MLAAAVAAEEWEVPVEDPEDWEADPVADRAVLAVVPVVLEAGPVVLDIDLLHLHRIMSAVGVRDITDPDTTMGVVWVV